MMDAIGDHDDTILQGKVLLVEDNKSNQLLMQTILEELGLEVSVADNGSKAYEAFINESFDVILMDENMPVMNGVESTQMIRRYENDNSLAPTPIIAVTANVQQGDKEKFLEAGMTDYVSKPVDMVQLEMTLSKYLG